LEGTAKHNDLFVFGLLHRVTSLRKPLSLFLIYLTLLSNSSPQYEEAINKIDTRHKNQDNISRHQNNCQPRENTRVRFSSMRKMRWIKFNLSFLQVCVLHNITKLGRARKSPRKGCPSVYKFPVQICVMVCKTKHFQTLSKIKFMYVCSL